MATRFTDIYDSFESSFMDKKELPQSLEKMWLIKAIGQYSVEINPLNFYEELDEFTNDLARYTIDILGTMMKVYYLEREISKVDKIASVVGKDLSINGQNGLQKYTHTEFLNIQTKLIDMLENLKPSAYS